MINILGHLSGFESVLGWWIAPYLTQPQSVPLKSCVSFQATVMQVCLQGWIYMVQILDSVYVIDISMKTKRKQWLTEQIVNLF